MNVNPEAVEAEKKKMGQDYGQDQKKAVADRLPRCKMPVEVRVNKAFSLFVLSSSNVVDGGKPDITANQ